MDASNRGETQTLHTTDGHPFAAYLAGPEQTRGAVLLCHEWWGLKGHNLAWADHLAEAGYRAIAVDLYDGRVTDDRQEEAA